MSPRSSGPPWRKATSWSWATCPPHKGETVRDLIEVRGAILLLLPPYSPDLNVLGLDPEDRDAFFKLKTLLRTAAERPSQISGDRIGSLLAFTPQECSNYFRHAGYAST
jgi:transposase